MKWINYHHLYYFREIALEGGIAKTAAKLRLGQPTLSTQLKQLEESLGQPLFDRKNRTLILTETGKVVLDYANEIFRLGNELQEVITSKVFTERIEFRLGAMDSVPKSLILSIVKEEIRDPRSGVTVLEGSGEELLRELAAHRLDVVISNFPPISRDQSLFAKSLAKVPVSVFAAPAFRRLKRNFPRSLEGQPFILPTSHSKLRHDLDHFFSLNKIHVRVAAEIQDTMMQQMLGVEGLGLVPLPEFAAKPFLMEKKLIHLGSLPHITEEYWLISAARKIENPAAAKLIRHFELPPQ